jgi:hypothetical protein
MLIPAAASLVDTLACHQRHRSGGPASRAALQLLARVFHTLAGPTGDLVRSPVAYLEPVLQLCPAVVRVVEGVARVIADDHQVAESRLGRHHQRRQQVLHTRHTTTRLWVGGLGGEAYPTPRAACRLALESGSFLNLCGLVTLRVVWAAITAISGSSRSGPATARHQSHHITIIVSRPCPQRSGTMPNLETMSCSRKSVAHADILVLICDQSVVKVACLWV